VHCIHRVVLRPGVSVQYCCQSEGQDFVENAWVGRNLAIGDEVLLSITSACPRCVMTTLAQGDLPRDLGILRTAAQYNDAHVGIYASVLRGGKVRRDDVLRLL